MKIGIRGAVRIAKENAAGIIESMDLAQLYGEGEYSVGIEENETVLTEAQMKVAAMIRGKRGR